MGNQDKVNRLRKQADYVTDYLDTNHSRFTARQRSREHTIKNRLGDIHQFLDRDQLRKAEDAWWEVNDLLVLLNRNM